MVRQTASANSSNINLGRLPTNTTSPQKSGYISGSGFAKQSFNLDQNSLSDFVSAIVNGSSHPVNTTVATELEIMNVTSPSGFLLKGYFKAINTGEYHFRLLTNDKVAVFLSGVKGSAELNYTAPLLSVDSYCNNASSVNFYVGCNLNQRKSRVINMTAGDTYYMEVYFMATSYSSFLKVAAQIPNTNTNLNSLVP